MKYRRAALLKKLLYKLEICDVNGPKQPQTECLSEGRLHPVIHRRGAGNVDPLRSAFRESSAARLDELGVTPRFGFFQAS